MIKAVKKDTGSFVYLKVQKHACPECGKEMKAIKMKKVVKAKSKEASGFNMNAAGHSLGEKVKFIWYELKCPICGNHYTENALRKIEEKAKKDAAEAKKEAKKSAVQTKKAEKKVESALKKEEKRLEAEKHKAEKKAAVKRIKEEKKAAARAKRKEEKS